MYSEIERKNAPVLAIDDSHPAKKFLKAFMECREHCAGRELDLDGQAPIDQAWTSATDGRVWKFSDFIYAYLCFTIVLEGLLKNAPRLTDGEMAVRDDIPRLRTMMVECADAAWRDSNHEILDLTNEVQRMLNLWEQYISFREGMISGSRR